MADLIEPAQSPEIVRAAKQLLSESPVGSSITRSREVETAATGLPPDGVEQPDTRVVLTGAKGGVRLSVLILVAVSLAAALPLLISVIQTLTRGRRGSFRIGPAEESTARASSLLVREQSGSAGMLLSAALLGLTYVAVWVPAVWAWSRGSSLQSHWVSSFETVSFGVAGAYVWSLSVLLLRTAHADLREPVIWRALLRSVCGIATSILIATWPVRSQGLLDAVAFLAGALGPFVFSQTVERLRPFFASKQYFENDTPLEAVRGIGVLQKRRLEEENIQTVQHLATADLRKLISRTPFPLSTLVDWIDQAIVLNHFSFEGAARLRQAGLTVSALELSLLAPEANPLLGSKGLENAAEALQLPQELLADRLNLLYHDGQLRRLVEVSERDDKWRWKHSSERPAS